ncbi:MAG: hypothetical protein ACI8ZB_002022 [Desulforhopalus sp.]|jgi:hypothetical protein
MSNYGNAQFLGLGKDHGILFMIQTPAHISSVR